MKTLDDATPKDIMQALVLVEELAQGFLDRRPDHEAWIAPALGWLEMMQDLARSDVH